jgi:hypothetical protein
VVTVTRNVHEMGAVCDWKIQLNELGSDDEETVHGKRKHEMNAETLSEQMK